MARIAVLGLWHLGCVVSTALADMGHTVTGTDFDTGIVQGLQQGLLPIYEPGLAERMTREFREKRLSFTASSPAALADADFAFIAFDTPVDENDESDLSPVEAALDLIADHGRGDVEIVLMSQVPVGTCRRLSERLHSRARSFSLVYQPENVRLGEAITTFLHPDLIVVGAEEESAAMHLLALYENLEGPRVVMSWESAEMVKHALNAFLGTSISFVNELADLAEGTGADIRDVARTLRMDRRIGPHAFLNPGPGFSGGTLQRDIQTLRRLGKQLGLPTQQLDATFEVNARRLPKIVSKIRRLCGQPGGMQIGVLGLTYKPGTNTLRRSSAVALSRLLIRDGNKVSAFDPQVPQSGPATVGIQICADPYLAAQGADVLVIMTPWAEFKELDLGRLQRAMRRGFVIDVHNILNDAEIRQAGLHYVGTGIGDNSRITP